MSLVCTVGYVLGPVRDTHGSGCRGRLWGLVGRSDRVNPWSPWDRSDLWALRAGRPWGPVARPALLSVGPCGPCSAPVPLSPSGPAGPCSPCGPSGPRSPEYLAALGFRPRRVALWPLLAWRPWGPSGPAGPFTETAERVVAMLSRVRCMARMPLKIASRSISSLSACASLCCSAVSSVDSSLVSSDVSVPVCACVVMRFLPSVSGPKTGPDERRRPSRHGAQCRTPERRTCIQMRGNTGLKGIWGVPASFREGRGCAGAVKNESGALLVHPFNQLLYMRLFVRSPSRSRVVCAASPGRCTRSRPPPRSSSGAWGESPGTVARPLSRSRSPAASTQGLMGREERAENAGVLFVYEGEARGVGKPFPVPGAGARRTPAPFGPAAGWPVLVLTLIGRNIPH